MNDQSHTSLDSKIGELKTDLKIDPNLKDWEAQLLKELRNIKVYGKVYFVVISIILVISVVTMIVSLIFEGEEIFGILIKEKYMYTSMVITFSLTLGLNYGPLTLRMEKIKTFLFLNQLKHEH